MSDDGRCARCGGDMERVLCDSCGGSGQTEPGELYEEDPLWYDEDDSAPCNPCLGAGGWWRCVNSEEWCAAHPLPTAAKVRSLPPPEGEG